MNKLLAYKPEPFPELDPETGEIELDPMTGEWTTSHTGEYEFDAIGGEWEREDFEEEYGRRRRPQISRKVPHHPVKKSVSHCGAKLLPSASHLKPQLRLPKLAPRSLPIPALRPVAIPFVPPLWVPHPDDYGRPDQNGPEGSHTPSPAEPGGEPPSENVSWIQDCLNRALGLNLLLDGVMGRETRSAVRIFQERRGLTINGLVGLETEEALRIACAARSGTAPTRTGVPTAEHKTELIKAPSRTSAPSGWRSDVNYDLSFRPEPFAEASEVRQNDTFGRKGIYSQQVRRIGNSLNFNIADSQDTPAEHKEEWEELFEEESGIKPDDNRVDVRAKFALPKMLKRPDMQSEALRLIDGINSGRLGGIFGNDYGIAVKVAKTHNRTRFQLIPKGEDGSLVLDAVNPIKGSPTVFFRGDDPDISKQPERFYAALSKASRIFALWKNSQIGVCTQPGSVRCTNLVPESFCQINPSHNGAPRVVLRLDAPQLPLGSHSGRANAFGVSPQKQASRDVEMNKGLYLIEVGESEKCKLSISGFDMASVQYRWWVTVGNAFVVGSGPVVDVRGKTPGFSAVYVQVSDIHRTVVVSADMAVYSVDLAVNGNSVGSGHTYFMTRDHNPAKPVAYVPNLEAKIQSGGALALVGSLKPAVWTFKAIGRSKGVLPSSLHFLQGFQSGNNKVLRTPWSTQKGVDRTAISRVCMPPHGFNEGMVTFDTGFGWRRSFFVLVPGVVVLDPGHGLSGSDICPVGQIKGCSSPNNAYSSRKWPDRRTGKKVLERDMTWDMARRIKDKLLELRPDLQVVLTRGQGEALSGVNTREKIARERRNNPSGWDRARHAQNARADVFLSVHFNGNDDPTLRGVEVYFRDTHDVHHRPRVRDWNRGTARNPNPAQDIRLGQGILNAVDTALKTFDSVSYMRTVRPDTMSFKKALAPLNEEARGYGNTMPFHPVRGVLCEIEYISHPKVDELFNGVRQNEVRNRVAEKVASAIIQDIKNQP